MTLLLVLALPVAFACGYLVAYWRHTEPTLMVEKGQ